MNFRAIYKMTLDKLGMQEGNKQTDNIVKGAINQGYMILASKDCDVTSVEFDNLLSNIIQLPEDFLSLVIVKHDKLKTLRDNQYRIRGNKLVLGNAVPLDNCVITITYGVKPSELVENTDIPVISPKYHIGLYYYALFIYSDDPKYMALFNEILSDMEDMTAFENDESYEEAVTDSYASRRGDL